MVVHPVSHGVSRVPRYSGSRLSAPAFGYGALTLSSRPSHAVLLASSDRDVCPQPRRINPPVWPPPRSLATTCGISVDVFSCPYLDVSVQGVPFVRLFDSTHDTRVLLWWVSPFGNLRIKGYLLLPEAYRSLSRPSSAPDAKAFPLRLVAFTRFLHIFSVCRTADTIAWETRQLEIMDWLTDDVDWLTGQKHAPSRCIFRQNA